MKKKVGRNSPCPCGSEKKYKHCCIDKEFDWLEDKEGNITRAIKINNETANFFKKQEEYFKEVFGRKPAEEDPVFFQQYNEPIEIMNETIVSYMKEAGIEPAIIYAFKKTGRILTEKNKSNLTNAEIQEWENAINEYEENKKLSSDSKSSSIELSYIDLTHEYKSCLYLYGMILAKVGSIDIFHGVSFKDFILFCVTKTQKTLNAILNLIENGLSEDAFILIRSIYESFLYISFVLKNPNKFDDLVTAKLGLYLGTHKYATKKGKEDRRTIVEVANEEKKFKGHISTYKMAQSTGYNEDVKIFDILYDFLSSYTHPGVLSLLAYVNEDKRFDATMRNINFETIVLTIFISTLILDKLRSYSDIPETIKEDITTFITRIKPKMNDSFYYFSRDLEDLKQLLVKRINKIENKT